MSLSTSRQGKVYFSNTGATVVNNISDFALRQPATTDAMATFYDRQKIVSGYLYSEMTADIDASAPGTGIAPLNLFVAGCQSVILQPIGNVGTITVKGSLDGTTFVATGITIGSDGFFRISAPANSYKWIQVSCTGSSGTYSVYMMIS